MSGLVKFRQRVRPEWIDYNGHLSEAYYVLVFGFATDAVMDQLGLDETYRTETGCSLYTVEAHVRYLREVPPDSELVVTTRIVGGGPKKLRLCHEMVVEGVLVSTEEILALHVDSARGRSAPFPEKVAARIAELTEEPPEYAGRAIG
ncbi:acyl-CoA thioester hydrolase [Saccharopolyspora erythraea NRRL 2338]|uniref:Thioesterase-like protein n=2 Tax=Saccharopolyspora erythraea TaxID=1836 RepID=A4FGG3_SACEN|nr:thioesterase family protein [Saccharopolyspora erythraea]EQD83951.1 4-hydroxybenzoyl-CoA thioesterase [Saccharopolyspora erythraea D]PFG96843.1 acyl-CoA thioester hydrolase [Saccharopolyspora erythraea NRRL 2338]QRK87082.1 thioesterase family protein [Saccharopolyspora erythraea]CAM03138.1 thioesterase-like protein [Saccharopolyspora erythraea NRRL 2338]